MNKRNGQHSGLPDSESTPRDPFAGSSAEDFSRYSRYAVESRYLHRNGSAKDAAASDVKDNTPAQGLFKEDELDAIEGGELSAEARERRSRYQPVGPRAERLAQQTRKDAAEIEIPTASETLKPPRPAPSTDEAEALIAASGSSAAADAHLKADRTPSHARHAAASPSDDAPLTSTPPHSGAHLTPKSTHSDALLNAEPTHADARQTPVPTPLEAHYSKNPAQDLEIPLITPSSAADSSAYADDVANTPYSEPDTYLDKTRKTKRRRRRIIGVVVACVLALVVCGVGFAYAYVNTINSNLQQNVDQETLDVLDTEEAGDPFYMLLMGTDGSTERRASAEYAGDNFRADSMMLLRIDPQNRKVACVSLIRDTKMDFGADGGIQKLNAAHAIGGTDFTIKTVSKLAGVPISHYAIIDFDGFKEVIDSLGGVEVDVQVEIDDDMAGGHLDAGVQTLNGEQALILCRSRHNYDDIGDGDRYRSANQRMVIAAIAKKVLASDVSSMLSTVQTLSQYIETDMGVFDIVGLGNSMRGINMDTDFYTAVMPTESEYTDGIWWDILDKAAWKKMMTRMDQGLPPAEEDEIDPYTGIVISNAGNAGSGLGSDDAAGSTDAGAAGTAGAAASANHTGTVAVRNGCGTVGVAAEAAEIIGLMGFTTDAANANSSSFDETVIVYERPDQKAEAQQIADALGVGKVVQDNNEYDYDADYLVVIGSDWSSGAASSTARVAAESGAGAIR